ncbi:GerMN domain-containing protein [Thermohalobacter berrensis]|uniref:GerMN domain-containing protein n=1 Tax=Thermohalobacter berrensis TaxID=99594 RepID=A0A419SV11_9FIRM|nr:GerMN domain-containing protein [Thermohalobacter berrensis]RKD29064.1 hypothetical protein BET03_05820 [Thermohalobacter berrensis]
MLRKSIVIILSLVLIISFVACTGNDVENNVPEENGEQQNEENNNDIVNPEPEENLEEIVLYFADDQAMNLVKSKVKVELGNKTLEEVVLEKLKEGPESEELIKTIPSQVEIISVEVVDNTAFVNLSSKNLHGGSTMETFLIASIVKSLTEIDYIDKVQFLVDGKKRETLMGHIMIKDPFTSEEVEQFVNTKE